MTTIADRISNRQYKWLMGLLTVAFVELGAGLHAARATVTLNSPFGANVPVAVAFGAFASAPGQAAVWKRLSDGACMINVIGDAAGLNDGYVVNGSSGNDTFIVVETAPGSVYNFCGTLVSLRYNGHFLDLYGGAGNDNITTNTGDTWIFGEAGHDGLLTRNGIGRAWGGDGNDSIFAFNGAGNTESLRGEAGADCLQDANGATLTLDCGAGTTDRVSTVSATPMHPEGCETTIAFNCPSTP